MNDLTGHNETSNESPHKFMGRRIFEKYQKVYGTNLQGCCPVIAAEIANAVGGEVVAGYLTWYGGACRRSHWWVEAEGETIDPMGDDFLKGEDGPGRTEIHRDRSIFDKVLPLYEKWRR